MKKLIIIAVVVIIIIVILKKLLPNTNKALIARKDATKEALKAGIAAFDDSLSKKVAPTNKVA